MKVLHAGIVRGFGKPDITQEPSVKFLNTLLNIGESIIANATVTPTT